MPSGKQIDRMRKVLRSIRRDADELNDYGVGDRIGRSATYALELLGDFELRLEPACEELLAVVRDSVTA